MGIQSIKEFLRYWGIQYQCPICGGRFRKMKSFGSPNRQNAMCPRCRSLERHRLLWIYLKNETDYFSHSYDVLDIAPKKFFQDRCLQLKNLNYLSADLQSELAMEKMDITSIDYPANTFDIIFCYHVLEHIEDDLTAMKELYRVLRPGGWAILQVPLYEDMAVTYEDFSIISPEDRKVAFGQDDHVRKYGRDYSIRLKEVGFTVDLIEYGSRLGATQQKKYCLQSGEKIVRCGK